MIPSPTHDARAKRMTFTDAGSRTAHDLGLRHKAALYPQTKEPAEAGSDASVDYQRPRVGLRRFLQ
ncbi:hypothetical protein EDD27_8854 [Nonomuraea polychroma]|uniref:Uncharacterized protein n=1 Tax=Nonomuraea polychroma TaxID=46176 RepID=A0A438MJK0_9ACTN|nr:hypothetical protein EDD27_8854 [Nonomuraea polychroma]